MNIKKSKKNIISKYKKTKKIIAWNIKLLENRQKSYIYKNYRNTCLIKQC